MTWWDPYISIAMEIIMAKADYSDSNHIFQGSLGMVYAEFLVVIRVVGIT